MQQETWKKNIYTCKRLFYSFTFKIQCKQNAL